MNSSKAEPSDFEPLSEKSQGNVPVFVDLDDTLIRSDLLIEAMILVLHQSFFRAVLLFFKIFKGALIFKNALVRIVSIDPQVLPYNPKVLEYIKLQKKAGRQVILATASHDVYARRIADYLDCFDHVIATDENENIKGEAKLDRIRAYCSEIKAENFEYIGDSRTDLVIWQAASHAVAVAPSKSVKKALEAAHPSLVLLEERHFRWLPYLKVLRPHQWVKNLLVLLPILLSHQLIDVGMWISTIGAFAVMCLFASSVYVINDVIDVSNDRLHHSKCDRPFASSALHLSLAPWFLLVLWTLSAVLCFLFLNVDTVLAILGYFCLTNMYSFWLKRKLLVDVFCLSGLYSARLTVGAFASGVVLSQWLIAFSMFFFCSLAFAKRYVEVFRNNKRNEIQYLGNPSDRLRGRAYQAADQQILQVVGPCSGYLSILIFALYCNSPQVLELYSNTQWLWCMSLILLYWITRLWFIAVRGNLHDDPIVFALKDRVSLLCGGIVFILGLLASF